MWLDIIIVDFYFIFVFLFVPPFSNVPGTSGTVGLGVFQLDSCAVLNHECVCCFLLCLCFFILFEGVVGCVH